jgi:alginate O-acetyltransferase complex protein AlgI
VVDVYRGVAPVQRSPARVALYISLFPQLVAGPIVRYGQIASALAHRHLDAQAFAEGARRFTTGLAKKVLIANTLAIPADRIFALPADQLGTGVAWLGVLCFTLQIYFDFAGYSDMALGLGRCLGFAFPENFEWPYTARSMREFWRRWHISLSTFFRDYLYIPLGGSRGSATRTHLNLLLVFVLCGLWHGASWSFVIWGLIHGAFLVLERTRFGERLGQAARPVQGAYVLSVVILAWVFFRADDLGAALAYLGAMAGLAGPAPAHHPFALYWNAQLGFTLLVGSLSLLPATERALAAARQLGAGWPRSSEAGRLIGAGALFWLCAMSLAAGTHNPFIYFRF